MSLPIYEGFTGIYFTPILIKNKYSTTPTHINKSIFSNIISKILTHLPLDNFNVTTNVTNIKNTLTIVDMQIMNNVLLYAIFAASGFFINLCQS